MPSSEARASRKALAGLVGFVARGDATAQPLSDRSERITLRRSDGSQREIDAALVRAALERGLITDKGPQSLAGRDALRTMRAYAPTPEGRAALKRWLSDPDSAFQSQHRTLFSKSDPDLGHLTINARESPLAALARIKARDGTLFLDPCHVDAGERLRADFTRGQMLPSLGQRWEPERPGSQPGAPGGAAEMTEAALSARLRVERALAEAGPELSGVLVDVCCFLKGLAEVERERQWPARSAKLMLRTALGALARHYAGAKRSR